MNSGGNMLINGQTRIKELLFFNQEEVILALVKLNKNFGKLRNPVLRKLFAGRVTIVDACRIAGCAINEFMDSMKKIGFNVEDGINQEEISLKPKRQIKQADSYLELDVRPMLAQNRDPLKEILANVNNLKEKEGLKLINTFEPIPLIHLLADKGFSYFTVTPSPDLVITYFNRIETKQEKVEEPTESNQANNKELFEETLRKFDLDHIRYLDVRSLEMPQPMLLILGQAPHLKYGEALFVYHKKIPVYLLPELEKQGLKYLFKDIAPEEVNMLIYRP